MVDPEVDDRPLTRAVCEFSGADGGHLEPSPVDDTHCLIAIHTYTRSRSVAMTMARAHIFAHLESPRGGEELPHSWP